MSSEPMTTILRPEHPRPDFVRETFFNLNGVWHFAFDDDDQVLAAGWMPSGVRLPLEITVPFAYQTRLSSLGPTDAIHPIIWYRRTFIVPQEMQGNRVLMGCWYTPVSGIWQTVYLEAVGDYAMRYIHVTPDIDHHTFTAEIALDKQPRVALEAELTVFFGGKVRQIVRVSVCDRIVRVPVEMIVRGTLDSFELWAPGHPALYDLRVRLLRDGEAVDQVDTYFGMRKIERRSGRIYLNNCPLYQKLRNR